MLLPTRIFWGNGHCFILALHIALIYAEMSSKSVPVFITVDPERERDNIEKVHDYVRGFHQDLIGSTGTVNDIRQVACAYRVYYMKTEEEGSDYLVDHSIVMYLMNPKMEFLTFFGKNYDANVLAKGIIKEIARHE